MKRWAGRRTASACYLSRRARFPTMAPCCTRCPWKAADCLKNCRCLSQWKDRILPTARTWLTCRCFSGSRQTKKIWIANLADSSITKIPRDNSNDFNPMWVGDRIYFLSDREGPVTLFYYDTKTTKVTRAIANHGLDFKSAAAGPGAIVYEQFGELHLYDLKTGQSKAVAVTLAGDLPELRPHYVNVAKRLRNADISPNGARAVFEARGEILTVPADKGDPRNLTNSTTAMEREPVWSPDGQSIAYFSDESGDYALYIRHQDGTGEAAKIPLGKAFYSTPRWSPDSKKIAYQDNHDHLFYVDLAV